MVAHVKEVNNAGFGEMYQSLFSLKGTGTDWGSAFLQNKLLETSLGINDRALLEISNSLSKESKLGKVGTMLEGIKKNQGHVRKRGRG